MENTVLFYPIFVLSSEVPVWIFRAQDRQV